jgi:hypothetical protein
MLLIKLDDLPYKWYKVEEANGENWNWKILKGNFIIYYSFEIKLYHIELIVQEIQKKSERLMTMINKGMEKFDKGSTSNCNQIVVED